MSFYSPRTATSLIIANMVGVGVFTSLGLQLQNTTDGFLLLLMWFLGGLAALTGAMSYAELGGSFPRSGGEYNFLGRIYHPSAGFVSGWISMTIGFAAPIALIAMAFADIVIDVAGLKAGWAMPIAAGLVIICTWFHIQNHRQSSWFQDSFTFLKILLILIFCAAALILAPAPQPVDIIPEAQDLSEIFTSPFAVSLVYVAFAYTGWNAATYILDELEHPQKDLPRILIFGTVLVTVIYVLLNFVFLKVAPVEAMAGQKQVGSIAASYAFGENGGKIFSIMFALLFISSVGAMTLAGPRAVQAIGEDYRLFSFLGAKNKAGLCGDPRGQRQRGNGYGFAPRCSRTAQYAYRHAVRQCGRLRKSGHGLHRSGRCRHNSRGLRRYGQRRAQNDQRCQSYPNRARRNR